MYEHLLSTKDQTLLNRRDTLLLLNALLYPRDLCRVFVLARCSTKFGGCSLVAS